MNECGASLQEIFVELGFMVSIGTAAGVNMASINTCALAGCSKPVWASSPGREEPHLTCGNLHHQLLMAGRFNPNMANTYSKILERNAEGFCALSSCEDPPFPDHSWCSRTHYLQWLFDFTSSFHEDQLCKVHGCTRHVFVEEDSTRSEFCGWRHYQKYAMSTAMPEQSRLPRLQEASGPLENPIEVTCDSRSSSRFFLDALRSYVTGGKVPNNISYCEDFFSIHPWEVCTDGQKNPLIVPLIYTSKGKRILKTKNGYHWKQQGRPKDKDGLTVKYYEYELLKGNQQDCNDMVYHMKEYTLKGFKDYSIIKLRNNYQRGKHAASSDQHACLSNDMTPQDAWNSNDVMPQSDELSDIFMNDLSPIISDIDYFGSDIHNPTGMDYS